MGVSMNRRVALVTGASGGIGRAIVDRLRQDGMEVVTLDVKGDVDLRVDIARDQLPADAFAHIDVCVSNAAIVDTIAPAHTMSIEKWQRDIDVNLTGAFRVIQACLPGMRARRYGRIVAMSSLAGRTGLSGQIAYAASKGGLQSAVKTVAAENASFGITANSVLPGLVLTPAVQALPASVRDRWIAAIPIKRPCMPQEVADLIAFLAGESTACITGQEIAIDGGLSLPRLTFGTDRDEGGR